ncbi:GNAT family N-acetyltransferase [Amycolatopsis alba]|uniref:N-acetyltransferase n=1 Tax=Amycolatopsis alba DSM 44262 TaxID=1125972 RepID=A0A229RLJ5_AMYAL|nr:GNAT family N-acetyltransferase [Amycolatopsis alba]OXM47536.1 N-acetyltransferase [Amycolatopsis alba DSM 44262]
MLAAPTHDPFARGDYAVRSARRHERCLNGHDLDIAGRGSGWDPILDLSIGSCELCVRLWLPRAQWLDVDLQFRDEAAASSSALVLAGRPPMVRGGVGQIILQLWGAAIADLDVQMCDRCQAGVVEQIRVDPGYLRRGIGTVLVDAALIRGRGYRWSTTSIAYTMTAKAFWAAQHLPRGTVLGEPRRCPHMLAIDEYSV